MCVNDIKKVDSLHTFIQLRETKLHLKLCQRIIFGWLSTEVDVGADLKFYVTMLGKKIIESNLQCFFL